MKMQKVFMFLVMAVIFSHCQLLAQQLAFPSAEGFGRFATGGRGGEVYHVTNLNDSGTGSFRDAVSKPNRIVVFDVGGIINIITRIVIQKNIYVAGQTAPGDGITLYGNGVALNSSSGNSIIRYIRIRMGENGDYRKDALGISDGQNYIFDNVSISWGWDGTVDVNGSNIDNLTFQDCIIGQGIDIVGHSTGGLMQSGKWSAIRTIYTDNQTRNPKGKGTQEVINCLMYNWGSNGYIMGDTDGLSEANVVGNNFVYGPSSSSNSHITGTTAAFHVYGSDNWVDANKNGKFDPSLMTDYKTATKVSTPFDYNGMNKVMSASKAFEYVLANAGASMPHDAVDKYLIDEIRSYGTKGAIIQRESDNGIAGNVGTVAGGVAPRDTDRDGMPDAWESNRGLNPALADDKGDDDGDGYTNIEEYLSCLVGESNDCDAPIVGPAEIIKQGAGSSSQTINLGQTIQGFNFAWVNASNVSVTGLPTGVIAVVNTTLKTLTFSGTPTQSGVFSYSVTTLGGNPNTTRSGTFTIIDPNPKDCNGTVNGTASLDNCDRCIGGTTGKIACTSVSEAETDACDYDGVTETKNTGYKGTSYLNIDNAIGNSLVFSVNATTAGNAVLSFRYANGGAASRSGQVELNGVLTNTMVVFASTGTFIDWKTEDVSLNLLSGKNIVKIIATTADGLPNIDQMGYVTAGVSKGSCLITNLENMANDDVKVYPNPFTESFFIQTTKSASYQLYDNLGSLVKEGEIDANVTVTGSLAKGIYLLKVLADNQTYNYKIIKE